MTAATANRADLADRIQAARERRARKDAGRAALQAARDAGLAARHSQKLARQKPADDLALPDEVPW
jgi:hypothetical protein